MHHLSDGSAGCLTRSARNAVRGTHSHFVFDLAILVVVASVLTAGRAFVASDTSSQEPAVEAVTDVASAAAEELAAPDTRGAREPSSRHGRLDDAREGTTSNEPPKLAYLSVGQELGSPALGGELYAEQPLSQRVTQRAPESVATSTAPSASSSLWDNRPSDLSADSQQPPKTEKGAIIVAQVSLGVDPDPAHWALIQAMIEPARTSQRDTGVPASVTMAQAIHESAWGKSALSRDANNFFGIKAQAKEGTKGSVAMNTGERIRGVDVVVKDRFRAYNNMTESFEDHGRFFVDNPRYAKAMANANDAKLFVRLISEAGYATDPSYARKVTAYMDKYNLYQYDLQ